MAYAHARTHTYTHKQMDSLIIHHHAIQYARVCVCVRACACYICIFSIATHLFQDSRWGKWLVCLLPLPITYVLMAYKLLQSSCLCISLTFFDKFAWSFCIVVFTCLTFCARLALLVCQLKKWFFKTTANLMKFL